MSVRVVVWAQNKGTHDAEVCPCRAKHLSQNSSLATNQSLLQFHSTATSWKISTSYSCLSAGLFQELCTVDCSLPLLGEKWVLFLCRAYHVSLFDGCSPSMSENIMGSLEQRNADISTPAALQDLVLAVTWQPDDVHLQGVQVTQVLDDAVFVSSSETAVLRCRMERGHTAAENAYV